MHIFDVIIFFKLHTIQQKMVQPTYLCPLGARKLAEGKGHETSCQTLFQILCVCVCVCVFVCIPVPLHRATRPVVYYT